MAIGSIRPLPGIARDGVETETIEIGRKVRAVVPDQRQEPPSGVTVEDQGVIVPRDLLPVPHLERLREVGHPLDAGDANLRRRVGANRQQQRAPHEARGQHTPSMPFDGIGAYGVLRGVLAMDATNLFHSLCYRPIRRASLTDPRDAQGL